jgi:fibronectin-binding autotransporter adhesin
MAEEIRMSNFKLKITLGILATVLAVMGTAGDAHAATKTWNGTVNNLWSNAGNWSGGVPVAGDRIVFSASGSNRTTTNDLAAGTVFYDITFLGNNYVINGNALGLSAGIASSAAPNTINVDIQVTAPQTIGGAICCGPLNLTGNVNLGSNLVTFDYQVNATGIISGAGGLALGDVITLSGNNTYTGPTTVAQRAQFDGSQPSSAVTAAGFGSATVSGKGTIGAVTLTSGASMSPGQGFGGNVGKLTSGSVTWNASSYLYAQLNGTTPGTGYDQLGVNGTVTIDGAAMLLPSLGFAPSNGQTFVIVDNDGSDAVIGTFNGLPQGATFTMNASEFQISYVGGTGNDIVLTVTAAAKTWTGAVSNVWSNAGNWLGGVPGPGSPLVFPSGASNLSNINDLGDGVAIKSILFTGNNYSLSGGAIFLSNGISSSTAPNTVGLDLTLTAPQTIGGALCCGPLNLTGAVYLGSNLLTFDYQVNATGIISGTGGLALGDVITLSANNTYTGPTTVAQRAQFDGVQTASAVTTQGFGNAVVSGMGRVGTLTLNSGGSVQPGQGFGGAVGKLGCGSVTFNTNSIFFPQINGTTPGTGYDQLAVTGTVTIGSGVSLGPSLGFTPTNGQSFVIIENDGTDPISGTFQGLPEGTTFSLNASTFKITYIGGTGNDVLLQVIAAAKTWTGAVNNLWSNPGNWLGGVPGNGDPIVFPAGASNLTNVNDINADVVFRSILFSGSNYNIGGYALALTDGISSTNAPNTINNDIYPAGPQTMGGAYCCGPLNLNGNIYPGSSLLTFDYQVNATGIISGSGGLALGDVITLSGNNTYTGPTTVAQRAQFDGVQPASAVSAGGFFNGVVSGKGTIGPLTINSGASIQPGQGLGGAAGKLTSGNLTMNANSYFYPQLSGSLPGVTYDQLSVNGTVTLDGSSSVYPTLGFTPAQGQVFVLVNNDGADPVVGQFNGLPQGANLNLGPYPFQISYIGKTGNDITLTSLSGDPFNRAPVAVSDAYGAAKNTPLSVTTPGVMTNDSDADLDPITVVLSDAVSTQGGSVSVAANGGFTYTPPTNFTGTDTFTYIISDGKDATDMATVTITVTNPAAVGDDTAEVPREFEVLAPRPNPGREPFDIRFGLPVAGRVEATVFDAAGRQVARLTSGESFSAGYHSVKWNGRDGSGAPAASGIYFVRVESGSHRVVQKVVMLSSR